MSTATVVIWLVNVFLLGFIAGGATIAYLQRRIRRDALRRRNDG